jgi:hypothetical protein
MSTKTITIAILSLVLLGCNAKLRTHTADPDKKHERFVHKRQKEHVKKETERIIYHEHEESPADKKFRFFDFY